MHCCGCICTRKRAARTAGGAGSSCAMTQASGLSLANQGHLVQMPLVGHLPTATLPSVGQLPIATLPLVEQLPIAKQVCNECKYHHQRSSKSALRLVHLQADARHMLEVVTCMRIAAKPSADGTKGFSS